MKFFTNKSIWSKIVIILIFVLLFEFMVTKPTLASGAEVGENVIEFGGKLMSPMLSLVVSLADGFMGIAQLSIMGTNESVLPIDVDASIWEILGKVFVVAGAVVAAIVVVVGAVVSGVGIFGLIAAIGGGLAKVGIAAGLGWIVVDMATNSAATGLSNVSASCFPDTIQLPSTVYLPVFSMSPEEIFQGKILLFNVNFFGKSKEIMAKGKDENGNVITEKSSVYGTKNSKITDLDKFYYTDDKGEEITTSKQDIASDLQETLATWYVGIRNIVLVGMMIVLLYIGIRMMLSTIASDKAKYNQLLQDWFVGLLLVFFIHYIMAFSVTLVQKLTDVVSSSVDKNAYAVKFPVDENGKMVKWFNENKMTYMVYDENGNCLGNEDGTQEVKESEAAYIIYPTNILGKLRLDMQMCSWGPNYIGYAIAYVVLVMFTLYFIFTYLRRVLYMAFLTMIAPMVALTYPIDKINDGSAQGFSKWFKEYIFNLLIQPMHLLLYYVLVTSAFNLAGKNLIYSLVAIGFMIPAEKLLRSLFGFEKAKTPGLLAGPAGAAITMGAMQKFAKLGPKPPKAAGKLSGSNGGEIIDSVKQPRFSGGVDEVSVMAGMDEKTKEIGQESSDMQENKKNVTDVDEEASMEKDKIQQGIDKGKTKQENSEIDVENDSVKMENDNLSRFPNKKKLSLSARRYGKQMVFRTKDELRKMPSTAIRGVGKAARLGATVAGGAVGLAAGIASGNPNQAFTNMVTGAAAGSAMANNGITDRIANKVESSEMFGKSTYDIDHSRAMNRDPKYREAIEQKQMKEQRKAYKEELYKTGMNNKDIKTMTEDGSMDKYIQNNLSAQNAVAAEKMRKENNISQEKAIAIAKYSDRIGDATKGPERKKWQDHIASEFVDKANLNEKQAGVAAKETMRSVDAFNKIKKKLS